MSAIPTQVDPQSGTGVFQAPAAGFPRRLSGPTRWTPREWRVVTLLAMVALVSVADLYLTLSYLQNGGMSEGNPIARWVMSLGCPWLLGVWKIGLVAFTCCILFAFKKRASAEIGTWLCCLTMAWLTFQWSSYANAVDAELRENPQLTEASSWVSFGQN
ncbi:MAG: DUF5658 family protein [Phycisphaerales bacterium]|nr:DUF5658 family protein [Phycisphaerales bacterium]